MKTMTRKEFDGNKPLSQVMIEADLNFNVIKRPVQFVDGDKIVGQYAIVREDNNKFFGFCADKYKPAQNQEQMQFFDDFAKVGKSMGITNAFHFDGGAIVGAQAPIRTFQVGKGDEVNSLLTFITKHNGKGGSSFVLSNTRAVCLNTVNRLIYEAGMSGISHKHGRAFDLNVAARIEEYFRMVTDQAYQFENDAKFLASVQITEKQLQEFFSALYQPDLKDVLNQNDYNLNMTRIQESFETQPGRNMSGGSFWTAFNAVTYHTDHVQGRDGTRQKNAMIGAGSNLKIKALTLALNMADAA